MLQVTAHYLNGTRTVECANLDEAKAFKRACRKYDDAATFTIERRRAAYYQTRSLQPSQFWIG